MWNQVAEITTKKEKTWSDVATKVICQDDGFGAATLDGRNFIGPPKMTLSFWDGNLKIFSFDVFE